MQISKIDAKTLASIVSEKAMGLTAHFIGLRDGKTPTARTPLYHGKTSEEVQAMWKDILSRYADTFPRLTEYEETRWAKFGPQGGYPPLEERMEDLDKYFSPRKTPQIDAQKLDRLIAKTRDYLFGKAHSVRMLTPEQVLDRDILEDKVDTNSGLPDFSKRNAADVQTRAVKDAKSGDWRNYPAILGSRSSKGKPRFIFMFPMSTNLVEKGFVIPLMEAIRANRPLSFSAWEGFDEVEEAIEEQGFFTGDIFASMDYQKMDTTVRAWHMENIVYPVLAPVLQPQFRPLLLESLLHSVSIPVMISEDKWVTGDHGEASGSGWTNFSESVLAQVIHFEIEEEVE